MAQKQAVGQYPKVLRKVAVERLKICDNIVVLPEDHDVERLVYRRSRFPCCLRSLMETSFPPISKIDPMRLQGHGSK